MRLFVDTGALLALNFARDQYHQRAVAIARRHQALGNRYVSTVLVLGEFHSHLLYLRGPRAALAALTSLTEDPAHEWLPVAADVVRSARTRWLAKYGDQRFSLTDAVSFEVMARAKLTHAFAFDAHFEVAGFALAT